jgi:hypothetical protein
MSLVRRYPLVSIFILAYALTWWASIVYVVYPNPFPVFPYGALPRSGHRATKGYRTRAPQPRG